jgi:hypothetical protein
MDNMAFVLTSYVVTLGGVAAYVGYVLARGRRAARHVPPEDRPWT